MAENSKHTEGSRLLKAAGKHGEVVAKLGSDPGLTTHWREGSKKPGPKWRAAIHRAYPYIPPIAWDLPVGSVVPEVPPPSEGNVVELYPGRVETESPDTVRLPSSTIGELDEQIARLRRQVQQAAFTSTREQHAAEQRLTGALRLRQKIEKEQELTEHRLVSEHPSWRRTRTALLAALEPYPDAMRDVVAALEELEM